MEGDIVSLQRYRNDCRRARRQKELLRTMDSAPHHLPQAFVMLITEVSDAFGITEDEMRDVFLQEVGPYNAERTLKEGLCPYPRQRAHLRRLAELARAKSEGASSG